MRIHELNKTHHRPKARRIARGNAGRGGTTAGRGTKGQKARTGANSNIPRTFIGGSTSLVQRLPKFKGFKTRFTKPVTVSVARLTPHFSEKDTISVASLIEKGIISAKEATRGVKVVSTSVKNTTKFQFDQSDTKLKVSQSLLASEKK